MNGGGNGAGAYVNGANAVVEHCLFYGNSQDGRQGATSKIGAVYLNAGTVRNCTIVNNNMGKAGGIYVAKGAKFYDSIVWGNKRVDGSDTDKDVCGAKATTVTNSWSSTLIGTVVNVKDPDNWVRRKILPIASVSAATYCNMSLRNRL